VGCVFLAEPAFYLATTARCGSFLDRSRRVTRASRPRRGHPPPHRPRPRATDVCSEGQESARSRPEPQGASGNRPAPTGRFPRSDRGEDGERATLPEASTSVSSLARWALGLPGQSSPPNARRFY